MSSNRWAWLTVMSGSMALLALVLVAFWPSLANGFIVIDDLEQIRDNPLVQRPLEASPIDLLLTPRHGYIVPVTQGIQIAVNALGGAEPLGFHVAAIAIHVLLLSFVYWVTARSTGHRGLSLLAVAAVGVHPMMVEPVCWATGIKDLLAASFALSATVVFVEAVERARERQGSRWLGAIAAALALLGMLSKPTVVLMGAAWLVYLLADGLAVRRNGREAKFAWPRTVTTVAGAVLAMGLTIGVLSRLTHDALLHNEARLSPLAPLQSLGHQFVHVVWPRSLHPLYFVDQVTPARDLRTYVGLLVLVGLIGVVWYLRRTPKALLLFALASFAYLPVSGVLPFPRQVADSYLYLPLLVLSMLTAGTLSRARRSVQVAGVALLVLTIPLSVTLSRRQSTRWADGDALWQPLVAENPSAVAWGGYATSLAVRGDAVRAVELFERAFSRGYLPSYLGDFGAVLARVGRYDDAECVLAEAAFLGTTPAIALRNYALVLVKRTTPPRFPETARFLVPLALHQIREGQLKLGAADTVRLERFMPMEMPSLSEVPSWPKQSCPILQTRGPRG